MAPRTRLSPDDRRAQLVDTAARAFAARPYDEVRMDEVAQRAGVSRGLLYRYFPTKHDLFAAVYRRAAGDLLDRTRLSADGDLLSQVVAGLEAHLDYFESHRHTVLAANRAFAGDPLIQTIIDDELAALRDRVVEVVGLSGRSRDVAAAAVLAWLTFVRTLCLEWLTSTGISRDEVHELCLGALRGTLATAAPTLPT